MSTERRVPPSLLLDSKDKDDNKNADPQSSSSLLVQALEVPSLDPNEAKLLLACSPLHGSLSSDFGTSPATSRNPLDDAFIPEHSDFTIPTSNVRGFWGAFSPPPDEFVEEQQDDNNTNRRSILGGRVQQKYKTQQQQQQPQYPQSSVPAQQGDRLPPQCQQKTASSYWSQTEDETSESPSSNEEGIVLVNGQERSMSDITPPASPTPKHRNHANQFHPDLLTTPASRKKKKKTNTPHRSRHHSHKKTLWKAHETIHAQSLLLGLAFMAVWSPQNCMAPNLTEMADQFGFNDKERDFYLGANVAFATGVLSLPIAAGIGILADLVNRKYLFVMTVLGGALASWATGASTTYRWLFVARLLNGGFMSGSVPVAFSLLGDLFATEERNAASSGLTAMMGVGIISGQVYAGVVGSTQGWPHAFYASAWLSLSMSILVVWLVTEPIRGGKEEVLQDMLRHGTRYERTISWSGFCHAMRHNESNAILMWQGFFSSVPWGIIFVFLNDYLSQERGFSVPDATYLVMMFGLGCAAGGVLGGYWGQLFQSWSRAYLPIFMAVTTFLAIFPFLGLLNSTFHNAHGVMAVFYSVMGGFTASLPSVNVRPCLINVNPPETRGAALTAANLIINLARGAGPSCITLMGAIWGVNRQFSFNVTLIFFWTLSALQLLFLARSLPRDQDAMETELAQYAASCMEQAMIAPNDEESIVSIEERITSFDSRAARESLKFMENALREIGEEVRDWRPFECADSSISEEDEEQEEEEGDDVMDIEDMEHRREIWKRQQQQRHGDWENSYQRGGLGMNGSSKDPVFGLDRKVATERTSLL